MDNLIFAFSSNLSHSESNLLWLILGDELLQLMKADKLAWFIILKEFALFILLTRNR